MVASVATRLQRFINSLPAPAEEELKHYLATVPVKPLRRLPSLSRLHARPYWIAFPVALTAHSVRGTWTLVRTRGFLHDVLCAQYYIYLAVRIRDDLLDGQAEGRALSGVANLLEGAAGEMLERYFERSSAFWRLLRLYKKQTAEGIKMVDQLQRRIGRNPGKVLDHFARTSSIFKIGSAAVCVATGRVKLMRTIETIFNHLAIGGQSIDDVRDIVEDLRRSRYNYAVQMLLKDCGRSGSPAEVFKEVLSALLNPRNLEEVVSVAVRQFQAAHRLLKTVHLRELYGIPVVQQRAAENLLHDIHRRRVAALFNWP